MSTAPFIKVTESSFSLVGFKNLDTKFRSFEKFLERESRSFDVDDVGKTITINVTDEIDARRLSENADLSRVAYFSDAGEVELNIAAPKKLGRPKNTVYMKSLDKGMTVNQFKKHTLSELQKTHITKSQIIKAKLLTKTALEKNLTNGVLKAVPHSNKIFIDREEVFKLM